MIRALLIVALLAFAAKAALAVTSYARAQQEARIVILEKAGRE